MGRDPETRFKHAYMNRRILISEHGRDRFCERVYPVVSDHEIFRALRESEPVNHPVIIASIGRKWKDRQRYQVLRISPDHTTIYVFGVDRRPWWILITCLPVKPGVRCLTRRIKQQSKENSHE